MERSTPRSPRLTIAYRSSTVRRGIKEAHLKMPQSFPQHGTERSHARIRAPLPLLPHEENEERSMRSGAAAEDEEEEILRGRWDVFRRLGGGFSAGGEDEVWRRGRTGSEQCGKGEASSRRTGHKERRHLLTITPQNIIAPNSNLIP